VFLGIPWPEKRCFIDTIDIFDFVETAAFTKERGMEALPDYVVVQIMSYVERKGELRLVNKKFRELIERYVRVAKLHIRGKMHRRLPFKTSKLVIGRIEGGYTPVFKDVTEVESVEVYKIIRADRFPSLEKLTVRVNNKTMKLLWSVLPKFAHLERLDVHPWWGGCELGEIQLPPNLHTLNLYHLDIAKTFVLPDSVTNVTFNSCDVVRIVLPWHGNIKEYSIENATDFDLKYKVETGWVKTDCKLVGHRHRRYVFKEFIVEATYGVLGVVCTPRA
jgi:hypothetical protein